MIVRVSFLVVVSVAAFTVSRMKINSPEKKDRKVRSQGNDDSNFHLQIGEEEKNSATKNISSEEEETVESEMQQYLQVEKNCRRFDLLICEQNSENVTEMELLQKSLKNFTQRKQTLEQKLLKLYGLKKQQSYIAQLRRELEEKTSELDRLNTTIASLQAERKILQENIKEGVMKKEQLDMANKLIDKLQKDVDGNDVKEQLLMLQEQVSKFQRYNISGSEATVVDDKVKAVRDIELEVLELKRRNKELELEKREVRIKLASTKARIREFSALSEMTQRKTMAKVEKEITSLRQVNKELSDQVERLKRNRFDMVQELVFQRWLHTCLRFEMQYHQEQAGKCLKHDFGHSSGRESYRKTNASTYEPDFDSISSNTSFVDSDEIDGTTFDSSSSNKSNNSTNKSMSMVPTNLSIPRTNVDSSTITLTQKLQRQNSTQSQETPSFPRLKRVSFSDSVKTSTYDYMPETTEDVMDDDKISSDSSGHGMELHSNINRSSENIHEQSSTKLNLLKAGNSSECAGNSNPVNNSSIAEEKISRVDVIHLDELNSRRPNVLPKTDMAKVSVEQLVAVLIFFVIMWLAYLFSK